MTSMNNSPPSNITVPHEYVERVINLLDPAQNQLFGISVEQATRIIQAGNVREIRNIGGHFAILAREGKQIRMARSLGRPMRYFLAKLTDGPCLIVAERIDEIRDYLKQAGLLDQFHPSYTRMVPAHHLTELQLVGCPDPNPRYERYFAPKRNRLSTDLNEIGKQYIGKLAEVCDRWLDQFDSREPIGVLFSGGIDSGAVFLVLYHLLLQRGESPSRLKAFTLSIDGCGADAKQADDFLKQLDLQIFLEVVDVSADAIDYRQAIRVVEDYKPLDVQAGAMAYALCQGIRQRYPDWTWLIDGDGGDENLKDYPIEENPELTIRSVLNNTMLYQEGWGVDAIKHSQTYSGGQSRGHVRSWATACEFQFRGFSPFALPDVIDIAEGIPFIELTGWDHQKLYALKGDIVRKGVKAITGMEMPIYEKRRFQHGVASEEDFSRFFPTDQLAYRQSFAEIYA